MRLLHQSIEAMSARGASMKSKRPKLNDAQERAATTTEGPLLIIAGPGSGKTHTLVERIVHLITEHKVAPTQLLISTFTEKAAAELVTRISNRLGELGVALNVHEMYLGTFHSICLRLLDENREHTRLKRNYAVLDQFDQQYLLYRALNDYKAIEGYDTIINNATGRWSQAADLAAWLSLVSEELLDVEHLLVAEDPRVRALGRLHLHYEQQLVAENALDFSTIELEAYRLLTGHPELLAALQVQLRYLMVDEYQDTNTVQEAILLLLAGGHNNLCVVGDDDQGIYRFRGATIRNILEFPKQFTIPCARVELTRNYRSHPGIIDFYNRWMDDTNWSDGSTTLRYQKTIKPQDGEFWEGPAVMRVSADGGDPAWHAEILAFLKHLRSSGALADWNQVAFLFHSVRADRTASLAQALESAGIPIYAPRSNLYFDREEVQLFLGALLFAFPMFPESLRKHWPTEADEPPVWAYYETCIGRFVESAMQPENKELLDWLRRRARDHVRLDHEGESAKHLDYAFSGLFYQVLQFPLFARYLGAESLGGLVDSRPARNLAQMSRLLVRFEHLHGIFTLGPRLRRDLVSLGNHYLRFLHDGGIAEFEDSAEFAPSGCVPFLTIHQAKGLEFPVVVCDSLHAVPRKQHTDLDAVLQTQFYRKKPFEPLDRIKVFDFKRLYYTAFSRPQNLLVLTCSEREGRQPVPSKWFRPCFEALPSWRGHCDALARIELAVIKPVDLKSEYSFTGHISLYENCARQYKFFKELEFTPVRSNSILFGTLVHQTIEDVHRTVLRGEPHRITTEQVEGWFEENYRYLTERERRHLAPHAKIAALGHVQRYVERHQGDWSHIREAEVGVSLVKERYILKGSVDLIQGLNDTVEIVDFKSEKKPDLERENDRIQRYRRQLEVYGHLVEARMGKKVTRLHLYYTGETSGNPRVSFPMDPHSVKATIRTFDRTVDKIENHQFHIATRPLKLCDGCDFRHHCDRL